MYYMFKSGVVVCTCNSPTLEVKFQSSVGWRKYQLRATVLDSLDSVERNLTKYYVYDSTLN